MSATSDTANSAETTVSPELAGDPTGEIGARSKTPKKKAATGKKLSPGRRQFLEFKAAYPDSLLLIRMGDFYEAFDEDAHTLSKVLGITLTPR